jgi:aspartyl protease family protein
MALFSDPHRDYTQTLGRGMFVFLFIISLGLLTLLFDRLLDHQRNPNQNLASQPSIGQTKEVVLKRNRLGHYVATGLINGQAVELMLDTGASDIVIPASLANHLDLKWGPPVVYRTANGTITAYTTRLLRVELGPIVLENLHGSINPHMDDKDVLLGMSFLKHLEFNQQGEYLTLHQYQ